MATSELPPLVLALWRQVFCRRMPAVCAIVSAGVALQSLSHWSETHAVMINKSQSLPNWAFLVEAHRFPKRGDYVVFDPGRSSMVSKYFGRRPAAFVKIAYGVPGDTVSRVGADVLVNGRKVASLKPFTRRGDPLAAGPTGIIPSGCVYAGSPHRDGFDSRYAAIGFVCRDRLAGVGRSIL